MLGRGLPNRDRRPAKNVLGDDALGDDVTRNDALRNDVIRDRDDVIRNDVILRRTLVLRGTLTIAAIFDAVAERFPRLPAYGLYLATLISRSITALRAALIRV
jgi:hypothetical protein